MKRIYFLLALSGCQSQAVTEPTSYQEPHDFAVLCENPATGVNNGRLIDPGLLTGVTPDGNAVTGPATWVQVATADAAKVCSVYGEVLPGGVAVVMTVPHNEKVSEP